ncbi:MAG: tetratricopeptide repeat protein [Desulfobulbaceae bacterium]|nr:tetratricopeptide repeat protein [Desulfobulbaceae bacterium]
MSKLYDVISRLEDIASKDEDEMAAVDIPFQQPQTEKKSPWIRIAILSGTLVCTGVIVIGATAWWQDWFSLKQPTIQPQSTPPSQTSLQTESHQIPGPVPTVITSAEPQPQPEVPDRVLQKDFLTETVPGTEGHAEPKINPSIVVLQPQASKVVPLIRDDNEDFGGEKIQTDEIDLPIETENRPVNGDVFQDKEYPRDTVIEPKPLSLEPKPESFTENQVIDNSFKIKQWLYQAEQLRKKDDWQGAVVLYARLWQIAKQPEIANNLAASLMQLNRNKEAYTILESGLLIAPKDRELIQNFEIVKQLIK